MLQAAIDAGVPVQAVALHYADAHHAASRVVDFTGAITLGRSLWRMASAQDLVLHMHVLPPVHATPGEHRRDLAARVQAAVVQAVQRVPVHDRASDVLAADAVARAAADEPRRVVLSS